MLVKGTETPLFENCFKYPRVSLHARVQPEWNDTGWEVGSVSKAPAVQAADWSLAPYTEAEPGECCSA